MQSSHYTGKYATQLTTSKHFYDTTAHRFVTDNCADMKLRCIRGLSANMDDLLTEKGQKEAQAFFQYVMWKIRNGYSERASAGAANGRFEAVRAMEVDGGAEHSDSFMHIALVTDYDPAAGELGLKSPLAAMIDRFCQRFPGKCEIVNLHEFPFAGGCLGCLQCIASGKCVYKDGFDSFLRAWAILSR